jgi:hypothetical protein
MEKCFLIKDKSGRAEPFTTTESHIRKYWPLEETDDNEIVLKEFLDEAKCGDKWQTNSEEIIYLDFVVN